jgi:hypothetical protein
MTLSGHFLKLPFTSVRFKVAFCLLFHRPFTHQMLFEKKQQLCDISKAYPSKQKQQTI